jgi:hypothetical protein
MPVPRVALLLTALSPCNKLVYGYMKHLSPLYVASGMK